jgi:hypothetical protein
MELTTIAGFAAGPFLVIFLGWFFTILARTFYGDWDQVLIPNGVKITIAPIVGIGLGIIGMFADTTLLDPPLKITLVSWIKYIMAGFLLGAVTIGLNEMRNGGKSGSASVKHVDLPAISREAKL